jgi:hypothetical protein
VGEKVDNYGVDNQSPCLRIRPKYGFDEPTESGAYMKNMQSFASRLATFGVAFVAMAWLNMASAQTGNQGVAKVVSVKGAARYTTDNTTWLPLKAGDLVKPGAVIQTASGSQVDLLLEGELPPAAGKLSSKAYRPEVAARANVVRVYENTVLGVDKLARIDTGADLVTETQLDLRKGKIVGTAKKLSGASKYEVKYGNGVAGIRGTTYSLTSGETAGSVKLRSVSVRTGSVVVAWVKPDGTVATQTVNAGEKFDPESGVIIRITAKEDAELEAVEYVAQGTEPLTPSVPQQDKTEIYVSPK